MLVDVHVYIYIIYIIHISWSLHSLNQVWYMVICWFAIQTVLEYLKQSWEKICFLVAIRSTLAKPFIAFPFFSGVRNAMIILQHIRGSSCYRTM